jgi:hypothetical protein
MTYAMTCLTCGSELDPQTGRCPKCSGAPVLPSYVQDNERDKVVLGHIASEPAATSTKGGYYERTDGKTSHTAHVAVGVSVTLFAIGMVLLGIFLLAAFAAGILLIAFAASGHGVVLAVLGGLIIVVAVAAGVRYIVGTLAFIASEKSKRSGGL